MHISSILAAATLVGAALLLGAPAQAQVQDDAAPRETVRVADLDLSHAAGARAALTRIRAAAARVCGPEPELMAWEAQRLHRACVEQSLREAIAAVSSPALDTVAGVRGAPQPYELARVDADSLRAGVR